MSTHGSRDGTTASGRSGLPDAVPVSLERVSRLSWELGDRVTSGADATRRSAWGCRTASWGVDAFDVTDHTAVLRVRTPVGRELFYGVADADLSAARARLAAAPDWERRD